MRLRDLTTPLYETLGKQNLTESKIDEYGRVLPGMKGARPTTQPQARRRDQQVRSQRRAEYQARVRAGKKDEEEILRKLTAIGLKVRNASDHEDMWDKIDFWITINNKEWPVQLKHRTGGDDIIYEIYKDAYNEMAPPNGRDYLGKAFFYVVENPRGEGYVITTKALKDVVDEYLQKFGVEPGEYKGATFKMTRDRATNHPKLMGFFPPSRYGKRLY